jgi:hypothetical protein
MHSRNGRVPRLAKAALEDWARDCRFFRTDGSCSAASPERRSGSKWLSTTSSCPLDPVLGGSKIGVVTWFTVYWESRYQTSMPGAL